MEWYDDPLRPARQLLLARRTAAGHAGEEDDGDLDPENADAAKVYLYARNQVVSVGMAGIAAISIPAVKIVMDLFGVRDQLPCLTRVMRVFEHFEAQRRERES